MLDIQKMLINMNYSKGVTINPQFIVIHDTDNRDYGANALANRNYFANHPEANASAHYIVDDKNIIQCLENNWRGWHIGDRYAGVNPSRPEANNGNTIGIEITVNPDSNFNTAMQNTIDLIKYLMMEYGISKNNVITHHDATGKNCPRKILEEGLWNWFKSQLDGEASEPPVVEKPQSSCDKAKQFVGSRCKELQEKLIKAGYDCGGYGADGIFGQGTYNSLIEFQKDYCSMVDGLAGAETFSKLDEILSSKNNKVNDNSGYSANVESIQHLCNVVLGVAIAEDGMWGTQTDNAVRRLPLCGIPYIQPTCTKWIQSRLGIDIDGIFLYGTASAVGEFQRNNSLDCDEIVGYQTYKAMALN